MKIDIDSRRRSCFKACFRCQRTAMEVKEQHASSSLRTELEAKRDLWRIQSQTPKMEVSSAWYSKSHNLNKVTWAPTRAFHFTNQHNLKRPKELGNMFSETSRMEPSWSPYIQLLWKHPWFILATMLLLDLPSDILIDLLSVCELKDVLRFEQVN